MQATTRTIEFAPGRSIHLETGRLAKQADGAVVARLGDTMVLCTAVLSRDIREGQSFFPLTVDYREKFSAGGKIPGGFIKREGRPDRQRDPHLAPRRPGRPSAFPGRLFPRGPDHLLRPLSADSEHDADVLAGVGASAALLAAGAPF